MALPNGRPGSIVTHPQREAMERDMLTGMRFREFTKLYPSISKAAFYRYRTGKAGRQIAATRAVEEMSVGDRLIDELTRIKKNTLKLYNEAMASKDRRTALMALREQTRQIEVFADMMLRAEELRRAAGHEEPIKILFEVV